MIGTTVSHYRILESIGAGGMGVVYLAEDERLHRKVALKFLPPVMAQDAHARARLLREAQAASALDHPNVAMVHDIGEWNGQLFIAMPFYDGETLRRRLERGALTIAEAVRIAGQIASGLAAAHRAGIVHRDLKPANVMLTHDGQVKIVDFGLAKVSSDTQATATRMTGAGMTVGTVAYMAPEQATGTDVDARADVWAFGITFYEMLAHHLPFPGETAPAILLAVASKTRVPVRDVRPELPEAVARILERALEKDPARRTIGAGDIADEIARWQLTLSAGTIDASPKRRLATRWWMAIAAVALLAVAASGAWFVRQNARTRWAREQALPQIDQLAEREQYAEAFAIAQQAKQYIPNDPVWKRIDPIVTRTVTVTTTPAGAAVSYRPVGSSAEWTRLGESPVVNAVVPSAYLEWRFERAGYVTATDAAAFALAPGLTFQVLLHTPEQTPSGMVHVTAGDGPRVALIAGLDHLPPQRLRDFWIDRYEVSNREFKRFVDAGGYRDRKYWLHPFVDGGRTLTFEQAMARFTDSAGRPGPATWESGTFLEGQDDLPVTGVSWYEAAAFAAFSGKSLPTIFHWSRVADQRLSGVVAPRSNFQGRGLMKVGASGGMNRYGAFAMAGNAKEWCWNSASDDKRFILGGAWDEPAYLFNDPDARSPFERAANFGFRTVKYADDDTVAKTGERIAFAARDFNRERPVGDDVFAAYRTLYEYDKGDLDARAEGSDDSNADWRVERVSYAAAYGRERVPALVYIPKRAQPPYQAVVYFPGSQTISQRSTTEINPRLFDWVIKSGRVFVHPIYKSTFERGDEIVDDYPKMTNTFREHVIAWSKDVRRSVDYLQARPDIDRDRIAYMGFSWGSGMAPIFLAVEPRFKAAVLVVGGFYVQPSKPEVEAINFAPRVKMPVLMLNGRFDFFLPEDGTQIPMFRLLGTPDAQKRRVAYDTGHNIPRPDLIRESLNWLDTYLGPVRQP
jgi:formylglycine-generating enzyme required for sulfatase activity/dienelactone hydrolase